MYISKYTYANVFNVYMYIHISTYVYIYIYVYPNVARLIHIKPVGSLLIVLY